MEERKFVNWKKEELNIKKIVKENFGKGKISNVRIEYTPVGEKIVISTHKPGLIIGKRGEKISELTEFLKKKFKMENLHIDIDEITTPEFDAQIVADNIALDLERFGALRFKAIAYRMLTKIKDAGALGAELRLSGKLPSDRARTWRFAFGYLKKTGDTSKIVDRAQSVAKTKQGVIGVKVAILPPGTKIHDHINVDEDLVNEIKKNVELKEESNKTKSGKKEK